MPDTASWKFTTTLSRQRISRWASDLAGAKPELDKAQSDREVSTADCALAIERGQQCIDLVSGQDSREAREFPSVHRRNAPIGPSAEPLHAQVAEKAADPLDHVLHRARRAAGCASEDVGKHVAHGQVSDDDGAAAVTIFEELANVTQIPAPSDGRQSARGPQVRVEPI